MSIPGGPLSAVTIATVAQAYAQLRSFAAISKPAGSAPDTIVLPSAGAGPTYSIQHLPFATEGGEVRGGAFTANSDGTITANVDMFAVAISCMVIAEFPFNDTVILGVGIGDPTNIPNEPGLQVGANYVSRFRDAERGEFNRETTFKINDQPVGKSTTDIEVNGIKQGDRIFPVMWTQEGDDSSVDVIDIIFSVEQIAV